MNKTLEMRLEGLCPPESTRFARCEKHHRDYILATGCPECVLDLPGLESVIHVAGEPVNRTLEEVAQEFDPNGKVPSDPGSKLDGGKPLAGELVLSFPRALEALVTVATYGAGKYSRHGFLQVPNAEVRYLDACMRHLLKYGQGEHLDPESGLPHIDHALWNVAAIVELGLRKDVTRNDPLAWKAGAPGCPHTRSKFVKTTTGEYRQCLGCGAILQTKTPPKPAAPPTERG